MADDTNVQRKSSQADIQSSNNSTDANKNRIPKALDFGEKNILHNYKYN